MKVIDDIMIPEQWHDFAVGTIVIDTKSILNIEGRVTAIPKTLGDCLTIIWKGQKSGERWYDNYAPNTDPIAKSWHIKSQPQGFMPHGTKYFKSVKKWADLPLGITVHDREVPMQTAVVTYPLPGSATVTWMQGLAAGNAEVFDMNTKPPKWMVYEIPPPMPGSETQSQARTLKRQDILNMIQDGMTLAYEGEEAEISIGENRKEERIKRREEELKNIPSQILNEYLEKNGI